MPICRVFWKIVLERKVDYHDLRNVDKTVYKSITNLKKGCAKGPSSDTFLSNL